MRLVLFTTKTDKGAKALEKEAGKMLLLCKTCFCEELVSKNGETLDSNHNPLSIDRNDKIILRDPYNSKNNYRFVTKNIIAKHNDNIALNKERYSKFPNYEDKLLQAKLFTKLGISLPEIQKGKNNKSIEFPVIVKPRIGSRGRGIRVLNDLKELDMFFTKKNPKNYIVQKYYKAVSEYRILVLKHKVLGVVDKNIFLKENGRIGVTIGKVITDLPEKIKQDCIKITKYLKADFVGIDVIYAEDGKYYFLEVNLSPQFSGFARSTNINVAKKIIETLL